LTREFWMMSAKQGEIRCVRYYLKTKSWSGCEMKIYARN